MDNNFNDEIKFTYSGIFTKNNAKVVHVYFERTSGTGNDYAEGSIPECQIKRQQGFTEDEILQLENYLKENSDIILSKAKEINFLNSWLKNE